MEAISRGMHFSAGDKPAEAAASDRAYPWILHPVIDTLFCCGGLLWILVLAEITLGKCNYSSPVGQMFWYGSILGNLILSNTHAVATYVRIFTSPQLREKVGKPTILSGILLLGVAVASLLNVQLALVLYKIWTFWIVQHFIAQGYGISLLYCIKGGYFLDRNEKRLLWWVFQSGLIYIYLLLCTGHEYGSSKFFELEVPFWGPLPAWTVSAWQSVVLCLLAAFVLCCVNKYLKEKKVIPFPAALTILSTVVIFGSMVSTNKFLTMIVPAFYHGSQYLVISASSLIKERGLPQGVTYHQIASQICTRPVVLWFAGLVAAGFTIWVFVPSLLMKLGFGYGLILVSIQASYSFHHFILDAYIWRLRDPKLRKLLVA